MISLFSKAQKEALKQELLLKGDFKTFIEVFPDSGIPRKVGRIAKKYFLENCEEYLEDACEEGNFEVVKFLIDEGVNIHFKNEEPLSIASAYGHVEIAKYLVEHGAIIQDKALMEANFTSGELVDYFLCKGADPSIFKEWLNPETLKYLISKNYDKEFFRSFLSEDVYLSYFAPKEKEIEPAQVEKNYSGFKPSNQIFNFGIPTSEEFKKMFDEELERIRSDEDIQKELNEKFKPIL